MISLNFNKSSNPLSSSQVIITCEQTDMANPASEFLQLDVAKFPLKNVTFIKVQFFVCGNIVFAWDD